MAHHGVHIKGSRQKICSESFHRNVSRFGIIFVWCQTRNQSLYLCGGGDKTYLATFPPFASPLHPLFLRMHSDSSRQVPHPSSFRISRFSYATGDRLAYLHLSMEEGGTIFSSASEPQVSIEFEKTRSHALRD